MYLKRFYLKNIVNKPCYRAADIVLLLLAACCIGLYLVAYRGMHSAIGPDDVRPLSLQLSLLPYYTLRTTSRLVLGMFWSLLFAGIAGTLAAKNKHAERIILPFINFMESIPLVGFMTFSTTFFMALYPHNIMGLEYAAVFAVFTGQAWNMALTLYQTIRIIPLRARERPQAEGE